MRNYKAIFDGVERSLLDEASRLMPRVDVQAVLDDYKHVEGKRFSDNECYQKLVHII